MGGAEHLEGFLVGVGGDRGGVVVELDGDRLVVAVERGHLGDRPVLEPDPVAFAQGGDGSGAGRDIRPAAVDVVVAGVRAGLVELGAVGLVAAALLVDAAAAAGAAAVGVGGRDAVPVIERVGVAVSAVVAVAVVVDGVQVRSDADALVRVVVDVEVEPGFGLLAGRELASGGHALRLAVGLAVGLGHRNSGALWRSWAASAAVGLSVS